MIEIKKIVLAYDDSEGSKKALAMAKTLAKSLSDIQLYVAHVFEEGVRTETVETAEGNGVAPLPIAINHFPADGIQVSPIPFDQRGVHKSEHTILTNSSEQAIANAKIELDTLISDVSYTILEGNPADSISEYVKEIQADMLIVGHSGIEGIKRKLLGGVSQKVSDQVPCHVLIAK